MAPKTFYVYWRLYTSNYAHPSYSLVVIIIIIQKYLLLFLLQLDDQSSFLFVYRIISADLFA